MGSASSGLRPGDRDRRSLFVPVAGSGEPEAPEDMPAEERLEFDRLVSLTKGVTFSQDSFILTECAELIVQHREVGKRAKANPGDEPLGRLWLAIGRQLNICLGKCGLDPKSRATLLKPNRTEATEPSRLDRIRGRNRNDE